MDNISDYDGISPTSQKCQVCKLNIPDEYMSGNFCKAYMNYRVIQMLARYGQNIFFFAIGFIILSIFEKSIRPYSLYVIGIAFLPVMILNLVQLKLHYRGIPTIARVIHQLRMYMIRKESRYYQSAISIVLKNGKEISSKLKQRIANELVNSVMLSPSFNPIQMLENWAKAFEMEESEFVKLLFDHTNILDGFGSIGGSGLLPDIMPHIKDDKVKEQIYEKLLESCKTLEMNNEEEKTYFLQDLYLVIDDIRDDLEADKKWELILQVIDAFEPEEPPKSAMQAFSLQMKDVQRVQLEKSQVELNQNNKENV